MCYKASYAKTKNEIKTETNLSIFHDRLVDFHGKIGHLQKESAPGKMTIIAVMQTEEKIWKSFWSSH